MLGYLSMCLSHQSSSLWCYVSPFLSSGAVCQVGGGGPAWDLATVENNMAIFQKVKLPFHSNISGENILKGVLTKQNFKQVQMKKR